MLQAIARARNPMIFSAHTRTSRSKESNKEVRGPLILLLVYLAGQGQGQGFSPRSHFPSSSPSPPPQLYNKEEESSSISAPLSASTPINTHPGKLFPTHPFCRFVLYCVTEWVVAGAQTLLGVNMEGRIPSGSYFQYAPTGPHAPLQRSSSLTDPERQVSPFSPFSTLSSLFTSCIWAIWFC